MPLPSQPLSPELIAEFHPKKNPGIDPHTLPSQANRKLWWLCQLGHEWEAYVFSRTKGAKCPICSNRKLLTGFNDLEFRFPDLAKEWDYSKNVLLPSEVLIGSSLVAHWVCSKGHEWTAVVYLRTKRNSGCLQCSGRKASKEKNFSTTHPAIATEWHPTKNGDATPQDFTFGSPKNVWWLGKDCGHEWQTRISNRVHGSNCPLCVGKLIVKDVNGLATTHPEVFALFDPEKNTIQEIEGAYSGSHKIRFWRNQNCGHSWKKSIFRQVQTNDCPVCSGRVVIASINDLATTHPEIASELLPEKSGVTATELHASSSRFVWWLCDADHEWFTSPGRRTQKNAQCQYCSGSFVLVGFNDFLSKEPELANEWHPTKNGDLTPDMFTAGSTVKVWWLCKQGHEWITSINERVGHKTNCPHCFQARQTSLAEKEIEDYLTLLGFDVITRDKTVLQGKEIDLWIPSHNLGIEYNGLYWHSEEHGKDKTYHYNKWLAAKKAGVQLIQVWEDDWILRKEVILRALAHKLGVSSEAATTIPLLAKTPSRVYARKTQVETLTTNQAREFLETNHIQGYASGSYYLGLMDDNELLRAVIVLKKEAGNVLNIVRYATNGTVVGGFTKLLKHAELAYKPASFITFADHMISDGGLYEKNGFAADKELAPDYMYVVGSQRKHKFGYRLTKFKSDPSLVWKEGLTEAELAKLNGLPRIWDAGKTRYRKSF